MSQSKSRKSNASGIASYTYTQGASKTLHNRFVATVIVKVGNPPNRPSATATYRIGWGKIDASVEPRTQAVGKIVNVYVHTTLSKRVVAYLLFPNGKLVTLYGRTGPHKFMHKRYKIPRGWVTARNRKVKVLARLQSGRPPVSTQTFFMVK